MLQNYGPEAAHDIRASVFRQLPDDFEYKLTDEDHALWKRIWDLCQDSSDAMKAFGLGAGWGRQQIEHIFAQMKLCEALERKETPDPELYKKLIRW